jgi:hypothetical protein
MSVAAFFNFLDSIMPLTPEKAKTMLEEAFSCGYETVTVEKASAILFNINRIQLNIIEGKLDGAELWRLFELDPKFGPWEETFPRCKPGFTMMLGVIFLKKKLFAKVYPDIEYGVSILDEILKKIV